MDNRQTDQDSLLSGYRALDLTDEKGLICGRILADLGVDVVKIERPAGDAARRLGPFLDDIPHPEMSLYWSAYNANKRSITLNIESRDGRDIFRRLVKNADFVLESFAPGYMDNLDAGYQSLRNINPRLVVTSISAFGQTGPYHNYVASDILGWAMGGAMYVTGDHDRPPLQVGFPQAYLNAGAQAAAGTMIAIYFREATGEGQHVDSSVQESVAWTLADCLPIWDFIRQNVKRAGSVRSRPPMYAPRRNIWACKNGFINFSLTGGDAGIKSSRALVEWMRVEGNVPDVLEVTDWVIDWSTMSVERLEELQTPISVFFRKHTVEEIYGQAIKRGILLMPLCTIEEVMTSPQLKEREFWQEVEHVEPGKAITYPGAFARISSLPLKVRRRAPLIGEHNFEIYEDELGFSRGEVLALFQAGVI